MLYTLIKGIEMQYIMPRLEPTHFSLNEIEKLSILFQFHTVSLCQDKSKSLGDRWKFSFSKTLINYSSVCAKVYNAMRDINVQWWVI